jgi:hypothetical protein
VSTLTLENNFKILATAGDVSIAQFPSAIGNWIANLFTNSTHKKIKYETISAEESADLRRRSAEAKLEKNKIGLDDLMKEYGL